MTDNIGVPDDFPARFLRGIPSSEYWDTIDGVAQVRAAAFQFLPSSVEPAGCWEMSISLDEDHPRVCDVLLNQKRRNGEPQFAGVVSVSFRDVARILEDEVRRGDVRFERKPTASNPYHGNILLAPEAAEKNGERRRLSHLIHRAAVHGPIETFVGSSVEKAIHQQNYRNDAGGTATTMAEATLNLSVSPDVLHESVAPLSVFLPSASQHLLHQCIDYIVISNSFVSSAMSSTPLASKCLIYVEDGSALRVMWRSVSVLLLLTFKAQAAPTYSLTTAGTAGKPVVQAGKLSERDALRVVSDAGHRIIEAQQSHMIGDAIL